MDLLNLSLIGWLFSAGSGLALVCGIWLIVVIHLRDEIARKELAARVIDDSVLFGIWLLGLAGGIGVLLGKSWSRVVLELFCWALMGLLMMSCWSRFRAAPPPRKMLALSLALFALPVVAICAATILSLRGDTALRVLAG
ncbi:MAG: hypothetical protein ABI654_07365 [Betaproteobacteria bacterium]